MSRSALAYLNRSPICLIGRSITTKAFMRQISRMSARGYSGARKKNRGARRRQIAFFREFYRSWVWDPKYAPK